MLAVATLAAVLAQDRRPPPGIGGDGEPFGTVELAALALFAGVAVWVVVRGGRSGRGRP